MVSAKGATTVYPEVWAEEFKAPFGKHVVEMNGTCGWGATNNYKNPSLTPDKCSYAYDDDTCDEGCAVTEGIYWSITSYLGGQYYKS